MNVKANVRDAALRSLSLSMGAFLLLSVAGLSSSSEADESLFVRSAQQLERLWGGVLGCAESDEPFTVRNRFDEEGGTQTPVLTGGSNDYSECGRRALRNAGSRMLVNTVENALREGGFALFREGFRIDSSIGWTWGENVRGAFDAVLPLWSDTGAGGTDKALFLQPGAVFWSGHAEQERIDANIGLVYRGSFSRDLVGGVSVFYDRNFERGLARLGGGLDIQGGIFTGGVNYYHPLDDEWTEGRTDYVEKALRGMDLRLGLS
ncbi:MAG: inverse autotransporter beta domain-containing protein, partial [Hyphomicrobiales bacterium]|nr:inverse autotransporter beta domain-containing protein [Hyphomicrobiales bacterium]